MFWKKKNIIDDNGIIKLGMISCNQGSSEEHFSKEEILRMFQALDRKLNVIILAVLSERKDIVNALQSSEYKLKSYRLSQELNDLELFNNKKL